MIRARATWIQFGMSLLVVSGVAAATEKQPTLPMCGPYTVAGPLVVAFFDYTNAADDSNSDEALSDLQFYLEPLRKRLAKSEFTVAECYRDGFDVTVNGKQQHFSTREVGVGYYLVQRGAAPRVVRGVNTDDDVIAAMKEYFGPAKVGAADGAGP